MSGTVIDSETIFITWSALPFSQQNGVVRRYDVNITELDTGYNFLETAASTELTLYSLHPHYTYMFEIAAVTVAVGPSSAPITLQTEQDGKPRQSLHSYCPDHVYILKSL